MTDTSNPFSRTPHDVRSHASRTNYLRDGGETPGRWEQWRFRFDNGYGASVVRGPGTYGSRDGLWELAVTHGDDWKSDYSTPITDDVLGWLTPVDVDLALTAIESLPAKAVAA